MRKIFSMVAVVLLVVGCGNNLNPMLSVEEYDQPQALGKLAISSPLTISANAVGGTAEIRPFSPHFIGVNVALDLGGDPDFPTTVASGVWVQFARSISGRSLEFDSGAQVSFSPDTRRWESAYRVVGKSGMYVVRAISGQGEILGQWHSVPLNQGELNKLVLVPGVRVRVVHKGRIWAMVLEGEEFPLAFPVSVFVNREAGNYQIFIPIPGIKPGRYEFSWRGETLIAGSGFVAPGDETFRFTSGIPHTFEPVDLWSIGIGPSRGELIIYSLLDGGLVDDGLAPIVRGDVNGDGRVSISDALIIATHVEGRVLITDPNRLQAADYSGDGQITHLDADLVGLADLLGATPLLGDVTQNGEVRAFDATRVSRHVAGVEPLASELEQFLADVNQDGRITKEDAEMILNIVVGNIPQPSF